MPIRSKTAQSQELIFRIGLTFLLLFVSRQKVNKEAIALLSLDGKINPDGDQDKPIYGQYAFSGIFSASLL